MKTHSLPPPTRRSRLLQGLLAASLAFAGSLSAATSSAVVGFYEVSIPAGNTAWVCGLITADLYQVTATSVTADVDGKALVSFSTPGWAVNEFNLHYAEPQAGVCQGLAIDILSNTTDTLKLDTTPAASGLTTGSELVVRKHNTIAGIFPTGGGFVPLEDSLTLFSSAGVQTQYFWNGTNWQTILGTPSDSVKVRPGQGFLIFASDPVNVILGRGETCYVKTTPTKIRVNANVPNFVGALNPLGANATLADLGVLPTMEPDEDSVVLFTGSGTFRQNGVFVSDGTHFYSGTSSNADSTAVPRGSSVLMSVFVSKNVSFAPVTVSP